MKYALYPRFFLMVVLTLSGCVPSSLAIVATQTETQHSSPAFTQPMSTPAVALTETVTALPPATLEPERAKETISKLLQTSVDCESPCFWGIMPTQTTLDEAENIFGHLGLQSKSTTYEGKEFYGIEYDFDSGTSITTTLTVQDKIVENLRVDILPEIQKVGVPREWLAYSPEILISRYGPPSRVAFALDWGPRSYFEMDMYFDVVDLIVQYAGHDIIPRQKGSSRVCPLTDQFEIVHLWMGKNPVHPPAEAVALEKATSMTLEQFSTLMMAEANQACFTVKGEAFP